ncbi:hypothetical protein A3F00_03690 [Candidatus Daviesbacteria bacterium RIFCSPHIGHO2_12_FULL_37_11]|uniref:Glycosyl transferase family 1 n=1 Tax=Candidatus Daviesbacteria bacterium RIFCSPHIGHO2_12_FULL_37_11 TaxID=1797777 RepID=A0A1F5KCH2_9BACT|nr:MAG: hypothetical protein A2111_03020 [Candidatus Daviesbacteria bacterium GWA1_38_6]OGE16383.1 MAG: hypothetical protein A2769_00340 [Candidatus Daviesbacteria bacterium RIFCSPHIGHO2_01_FULL_37_27]OGE38646.1 MAG: hypothetical protein A3F00_03690 [Candidatus Daviesbacteria bacterium RIFCSPHIGHO2_12_FULL_37_11]OGE45970.1 MAG: hypothetical protein A3B39_02960 [Candidatus Daviesbacteria bacterium RIFCSPLOWO2_01_FULL_37_10]
MIIGIDGSRAFLKDKTGTENYSYQLLKALAKLEQSSFSSKIDSKNQYIVYLRTQGDALRGWSGNFKFVELKWPRLWTQVGLARQTFKDKLDVLFIPAHTSPLIHKPGLKTVVTVHDLGAEYLPKMHQLKQRLYLKYITKYQLKSATKLIAVSNATKKDLVKKIGIDPKKIEVIYEGYDENLFKPVKNDILVNSLKEFDLVAGKYFLFIGTIQPRKNLERLIKAFSSVISSGTRNLKIKKAKSRDLSLIARDDNSKLVLVGSRGWLSDSIYKLPAKLGIEDKVKFLGRVEDKDLPALYSGAIALTFPSLFEGFGLPILEAQACGCPVLTSSTSSMPEIAGKGAIYVNPHSLDDIIRGMSRVKSQESRVKLVRAGFENVKRFAWEKCAKETLKVLESV